MRAVCGALRLTAGLAALYIRSSMRFIGLIETTPKEYQLFVYLTADPQ
jgi:hypothetical protein